jgi:hypothetical protein
MRLKSASILFILILCGLSTSSRIRAEGLPLGSPAPGFRLPLADGPGEVALSDFVNKKIVIVHFWKSR